MIPWLADRARTPWRAAPARTNSMVAAEAAILDAAADAATGAAANGIAINFNRDVDHDGDAATPTRDTLGVRH